MAPLNASLRKFHAHICRTLNRIQSRIFPTAFTSNQNLLVCAPTGAGKTNIAMITVLREIGAHMNEKNGSIDKEAFKVCSLSLFTACFGAQHSFSLAQLSLVPCLSKQKAAVC